MRCAVLGARLLWCLCGVSWVSPLESAATLGIAKTFRMFKPVMAQASWLEIQHWGTSFHCLLGDKVALPDDQPSAARELSREASAVRQEPN